MAPSSPPSARGAETRLVIVVSAVVFVDTMLYAVIAPLLPGFAHHLHMSKLAAGLMTASYPIGTLLGSIPGGVLVVRFGPRFTVCTGMTLFACSTAAFGFLDSAATLDLARLVEGVGSACSWSGGLAWIVAETPVERRGAMIGRALAAAVGGSLFGPAIGALATATGRPALFCAVAAVAVGLIAATLALPAHEPAADQGVRALARAVRRPMIAAAMWLMTLPAIASGIISVLGPLRLHRLGAGAVAIGAIYLVAAAIEAALSPPIGSLSDRRGRLVPVRAGLVVTTVTLLCFTLPGTAALLGAVIVLIAMSLSAFWGPSMAMLTDAAERYGLDQGLAAALLNLAWAGGQVIGSGGGGAIAKVAGDAVPTAIAAGLCAVTLAALARAGARVAPVTATAEAVHQGSEAVRQS